jgi:5,10-methylenetetrahydromethanopterin reductase
MARLGVVFRNELGFRDQLDCAVLADQRGYESLWVPEGRTGDAFTTLAGFAMRTQRIGLATGIIPIYLRTPSLTAMTVANLEDISQGRALAGLGIGHRGTTDRGHSVTIDAPFRTLREFVDIIRRLLAGEAVDHQGESYQLRYKLGAPPRRAKVPIALAALGPRMLECAGEIADYVLLNWTTLPYLQVALDHMRIGAARAGRTLADLEIACYIRVAPSEDWAAIRRAFQRSFVSYAAQPFYNHMLQLSGFADLVTAMMQAMQQGDSTQAMDLVSDDIIDALVAHGTPEQCRQQVEAYRQAGVTLPVVYPLVMGSDEKAGIMQTFEVFEP